MSDRLLEVGLALSLAVMLAAVVTSFTGYLETAGFLAGVSFFIMVAGLIVNAIIGLLR